jgi:ADP-heptose:LPS heptosyltransferase
MTAVGINSKKSATSTPLVSRDTGSQRVLLRSFPHSDAELAQFDSSLRFGTPPRILVLKLDHLGDFLIGLPALQQLRSVFAGAHITLICGSWNVRTARDLEIADEVRTFNYFPENAQDWDGQIGQVVVDRFRRTCAGTFDVALDLRVDEDTRPLLREVDATLRCGIGSRQRHPYLNVVLPPEFERRETALPGSEELIIRPNGFHSRMTTQTPFYHETDFSSTNGHLVYGPYCQLPLGELQVELAYQLITPPFWSPRVRMIIDVVRHDRQEPVAVLDVPRLPKSDLFHAQLRFFNDDPYARYEIRTLIQGKPRLACLRFFGMQLHVERAPQARFRPAELHIGESLSLLVRLIAERIRPLYQRELRDQIGSASGRAARPAGVSSTAKCIVMAPLSNSTLRNWPLDRYTRLIGLLLSEIDCYIVLAGARGQASQLAAVWEELDGDRRIVNLAGQTDWSDLADVVGDADLVISNNSGIAHLAAAHGVPTLAIYSGSHQPQEWGPRGTATRTLMASVPCSPCGHDKLEACPHDHMCMTLIQPENVLHHALEMLTKLQRSRPIDSLRRREQGAR